MSDDSNTHRSIDYQDVMDAFKNLNEPLVREMQEIRLRLDRAASKTDVEILRQAISNLENRTYSSQVVDLKLEHVRSELEAHRATTKSTHESHEAAIADLRQTIKDVTTAQATMLKRWLIVAGTIITVLWGLINLLHMVFHIF